MVLRTISTEAVSGNTSIIEGDGNFQFTNPAIEESPESMNKNSKKQEAGENTIIVEDYQKNPEEMSSVEKEHILIPSALTPSVSTSCVSTPGISRGVKSRKNKAENRLQSSANATAILAEVSTKELKLKENYYNKKLEYLQRQTIAMENIANALVKKINCENE